MPLLTFGHGRLERQELADLLRDARIERVVDVRRFPGSRANEAAARGQVPELLAEIGIAYRWDQRLGGRRRLDKHTPSPDTWWRVEAFRAYSAWTRGDEFQTALPDLVDDIGTARTAVMCSESVWWRCHRRIIADVVALGCGIPVEHLMHTGKLTAHEPSEGARVLEGTRLVWDDAG
ncbi:DUF488 domain-containing protein [Paramicrobacterium humi]|nr:DUF488 domain-containing protein [Microbacterium humi]